MSYDPNVWVLEVARVYDPNVWEKSFYSPSSEQFEDCLVKCAEAQKSYTPLQYHRRLIYRIRQYKTNEIIPGDLIV